MEVDTNKLLVRIEKTQYYATGTFDRLSQVLKFYFEIILILSSGLNLNLFYRGYNVRSVPSYSSGAISGKHSIPHFQ